MSVVKKTPRQMYLANYADSRQPRYELIGGEIFAMVGASGKHILIAGNLHTALNVHLKGKKCVPFMESLKVYIDDSNYFYPDLVVDCGYDDSLPDYASQPVMVVEVLSPSTRKFDLTTKFEQYKTLNSLQEYVLIEQSAMQVSVFRRSQDWAVTHYFAGDGVVFESVGLSLPIEEIYERIVFDDKTHARVKIL